jgi:tetratricopeptide (TPR) repeat protein
MLVLLFAVLVTVGLVFNHVGRQARRAQTALSEGEAHLDQHRYAEALTALTHGTALVEDLPFHAVIKRQLHESRREAERGQAAQELHLLSERLRPLYSATDLPQAQARIAEAHCRAVWQQRDVIVRRLGPSPASGSERQVRTDLLDLAILGVHLRVRLASHNEVRSARLQALDVLDEAEDQIGPSCVLCRERQAHARALGLTDMAEAAARQAAALAPRTAWEHCAVGLVHFRAGDFRRAAEEMERAVELEPEGLWPNFYRGSCACHLGQFEEASTAFSVCVALAPRCAWCYANRGLAYGARGQLDRALGDYDRALRLDPTLGAALLGRSALHYRQGRYAAALEDVLRALELGMDTTSIRITEL